MIRNVKLNMYENNCRLSQNDVNLIIPTMPLTRHLLNFGNKFLIVFFLPDLVPHARVLRRLPETTVGAVPASAGRRVSAVPR